MDPEEPVVTWVAVVKEVLGIGHERRCAERVPDLIDVLAFEVLEDGDRSDGEIHPPVRWHAGVDAPAAVGFDHRDQPVQLCTLGGIRAPLRVDRCGVAACGGAALYPGPRGDHQPPRYPE